MKGSTGKTLAVINSCTTKEQLNVASMYVFLYTRQLQRYSVTYNFIHDVFNIKSTELELHLHKQTGKIQ